MKWGETALMLVAMAAAWPAAAEDQLPAAPAVTPAAAPRTPAPPEAKVYIIAPVNGARVRSPFLVQFGLRGMGVTQAGSSPPNAGHHHLLVDVKEPISGGEVIPSNKSYLHFGGGQTETTLDLPPGRHTLQLVLGDAKHRPFLPMMASQKIEVTVVSPHAKKRHHKRTAVH